MIELALVMIAIASPVLIALFFKHYFQYRATISSQVEALEKKLHDADRDELQRKVQTLQSRVETLEAIVTDDSYQLKSGIANL